MTSKPSSPPSIDELGERILSNLSQVQGFLQVLNSEIDNPQKNGPGQSSDEWKKQTLVLTDHLESLDKILKAKMGRS